MWVKVTIKTTGRVTWLNLNQLQGMQWIKLDTPPKAKAEWCTYAWDAHDSQWYIKETPEQIMEQLK